MAEDFFSRIKQFGLTPALDPSPLSLPGLIKAIGWSFLASPRVGILNILLRKFVGFEGESGPLNIYSLPGIVFVSTLSMVPSIALMIAGAFRNFDARFEEASQVCGASVLRSQLHITFPMLRPALLAAFIYYLANALDDFQIPAVLGLNAGIHVFSTKIFLATNPTFGLPDYGLASGFAMMLFLMALLLIVLYRRMTRTGESFAVVTGKGYRPHRVPLGKWKYAAFAGIALYLLLAAIAPLLVLLWISFQPFLSMPSLEAMAQITFANYRELWQVSHFKQALINTVAVSAVVPSVTVFLSTVTAWMAVRRPFFGSSIPDLLTFVNSAVPSVVFGLALIFVYLSFPVIPVYGTVWILVIAFTTRYLTYTTRLMHAAIMQIHQELEEASETSGASRWTTLLRITVPLLFPSMVNGWIWVAVHSLREVTIAVMLMTHANIVLSALIWEKFQEAGSHGLGAAMSILFVSVSFLLTFVGRRVLLRVSMQ